MNIISLPVPPEENRRLDSLQDYQILDTINDEELDQLTDLAVSIFQVPIALITIIDEETGWFKSNFGLSLKQAESTTSFCQYTLMDYEVFEVGNTLSDQRFARNPLVIQAPYIRYYCGAPLINEGGYIMGSLAILDKEERKLDHKQKKTLQLLAQQVVNIFELKRKRRQLETEKAHLEDRVVQRTQHLEQKVSFLQGRIEKLIQSEKLLTDTLRLAKIGSWEYTVVTDQFLASEALAEILQVSKDALQSLNLFYQFIHGEDLKRFQEDLQGCIQSGESSEMEYKLLTKEGQQKYILIHIAPIHEADGKVKKLRGTCQDITERRLSQEAIAKSEALFSTVFRLNPFPTAITRMADGKILHVNEQALKAFGYSYEQIINRTTIQLNVWADPLEREELIKRLEKEHMIHGFETTFRNKQGQLWSAVNSLEVIDLDGEACILWIMQDITEQKKAEESIKAYAEQLERLNASKDKFFSIIAHDLLSPLNGVLGSSNLLSDHIDVLEGEEIQQLAQGIYASTTKLKRLLTNLLEWARMQTGGMAFQPKLVSLGQIVMEVVELLKDNAQKKQITVDIPLQEDIYLQADEHMVQSILRNLLANAIKFSRTGGHISITCQIVATQVQVSVRDKGIGMSKEVQEHLFEIDSKHSTLGTSGEKGTGLGLLLCKEFVEKHRGRIWVESEEGKGTAFTFTLARQGEKQ